LALSYWLLAIGYWLLAIGYWLLAIGYWLKNTNFIFCHSIIFPNFIQNELFMTQIKRLFDIPGYQLENYPKNDCLTAKVNGVWTKYSTKELVEMSNMMSRGLLALGVKPGDKIAMISNNRPEWNITDIAVLQAGAIDVPVYPTITPADYKFIFNDAGVKFCFVSSQELYDKVAAIKNEVPSLLDVYSYEKLPGVKFWKDVLDAGNKVEMAEVEKIKATVKEDDLATIIYTSGTTGVPKGVMLSHRNLVSNALNCKERLPVDCNGISLSFLPVCHVYERMLLYLYMLSGVSVYFAESLDTVGDNLREVKPQVFTAVPRLLEKVYDKIMAKGAELSFPKKQIFNWAVKLGMKYEPGGRNGFWYEARLSLARKLVFKKWKEALGGNVLAVASGSAALQPRLARIFMAAGIPVMEGYGLTETSPVISVNCEQEDGVRIGTVGRVIKDTQVKIAEDGEILCKGPQLMMGYYNRPDLTAEVIDKDGWFHTGDIGTFVDKDFLKITDRKKEIFKTSGGKYIAPQVMENRFKESHFIEQIMVIGEGQKHPAALVVPAFAYIKEWGNRKGMKFDSNAQMAENPEVMKRIMEEINTYNQNFGDWEKVKKIELIAEEWGVNTGEMTPTLKLKRKFIMEKYKEKVRRIYGE
jgi:long-chain acyl-CoA synthetase